MGEIRRLVYDMRAPALDGLGLVEALRRSLPSLARLRGDRYTCRRKRTSLPVFLLLLKSRQAVTNTARHIGTDQVRVAIEHESDQLLVTVRDGGESDGTWVPGVGLSSMRERAAEIGGSIDITTTGNGSQIVARLPLAAHRTVLPQSAGRDADEHRQPGRLPGQNV